MIWQYSARNLETLTVIFMPPKLTVPTDDKVGPCGIDLNHLNGDFGSYKLELCN